MRILLVDDHSLFLEGIKNFLSVSGIKVVGTATSALEALAKVEMFEPNLILMDVQMAECDGIAATRKIKSEYPHIQIVMLTASDDDESIFAALQAGASGYLLKNMDPTHFLQQLANLKDGEPALAPNLGKRVLQEFNNPTKTQKTAIASPPTRTVKQQLTERQAEILQSVSAGLTYKEIALHLNIKEITVKYHIREILNKLHLNNRTQLITFAAQKGLQ